MKKLLMVAAFISAITFTASAQDIKYGRINASEMMLLMPEMETAQTDIDAYEKELTAQIQTMHEEYGKLLREYQDGGQTMTALVRQQKEKDIMDLQTKIENFTQAAQQDMQEAAQRLIGPVQQKLMGAVVEVAKANNVTFVIDISQPPFIYMDEAKVYDMTADVKKNLNLEGRKIPARFLRENPMEAAQAGM